MSECLNCLKELTEGDSDNLCPFCLTVKKMDNFSRPLYTREGLILCPFISLILFFLGVIYSKHEIEYTTLSDFLIFMGFLILIISISISFEYKGQRRRNNKSVRYISKESPSEIIIKGYPTGTILALIFFGALTLMIALLFDNLFRGILFFYLFPSIVMFWGAYRYRTLTVFRIFDEGIKFDFELQDYANFSVKWNTVKKIEIFIRKVNYRPGGKSFSFHKEVFFRFYLGEKNSVISLDTTQFSKNKIIRIIKLIEDYSIKRNFEMIFSRDIVYDRYVSHH